MNNNLEIWNKVKITNPRDTKDLQQGRKITTIDAYTQIQNATEQFGPMGKGWGLLDLTHNTLPALQDGSIVVVSSANFFYKDAEGTNTIPLTIAGKLAYFTKEKKNREGVVYKPAAFTVDEEVHKKNITGLITKGLSYLGFNADVFMGKFEDNKYIQRISNRKEYNPTMQATVVKWAKENKLTIEDLREYYSAEEAQYQELEKALKAKPAPVKPAPAKEPAKPVAKKPVAKKAKKLPAKPVDGPRKAKGREQIIMAKSFIEKHGIPNNKWGDYFDLTIPQTEWMQKNVNI